MAYAVGQGGCLTRCDATAFPRGGLMGLSDRCTGAIPRIDALCRTIVAECVKRSFQGVLADFETNPYSDRLSFLSRLSARLSARGMALYCPLSLPAEGAVLLVGTGLSGGSLRALLDNGYQVVGVFCQPDRPKPPAAMARSVWRSTWNA